MTDHTEGHSPARNICTGCCRKQKFTLTVLNTKTRISRLYQLPSFTLINLPELQFFINKKGKNIMSFIECCTVLSSSVVSDSLRPHDCSLAGSSVHGDSPGKNTGVSCHALLQGIFPTQGWNPGLPHCRQILRCLRHQGSP